MVMLCNFSSCGSDELSDSDREGEENVDPETGISLSQEVDLGLSVNWAGWNVGASSPEKYGGYYSWGETVQKDNYSEDTYKYYYDTDGDGDKEYANIGNNICGTQYDVARQKWGGSWRMPTYDELSELRSKCTWTWITYKGINGYKVTGPNGNSIFLPAAGYRYGTSLYVYDQGSDGYYWSGTLREGTSNDAWRLYFHIDYHYLYDDYYLNYYVSSDRNDGFTVRPVK